MRCNKCKSEITYDTNYCPYCGEMLKEIKNNTYQDPFKDVRIDEHSNQYNYQTNYSSNKTKNNDIEIDKKNLKNNNSLIALVLALASIPITIYKYQFGLFTIFLSIFILIITYKNSNKNIRIISLILTILSLIATILISIFIIVGSIIITFENGYETSIKDYFINAFNCGFNEHRLEGYWINDYEEVLYLDASDNYYIYLDKNNLLDNYYYGNYKVDDGYDINDDEIIYGDDEYYYYQIKTDNNKTKYEGQIYYETIDLIENGFLLKLNKDNKNELVLIAEDTEIKFEKN